jgi:hypothetical protein
MIGIAAFLGDMTPEEMTMLPSSEDFMDDIYQTFMEGGNVKSEFQLSHLHSKKKDCLILFIYFE